MDQKTEVMVELTEEFERGEIDPSHSSVGDEDVYHLIQQLAGFWPKAKNSGMWLLRTKLLPSLHSLLAMRMRSVLMLCTTPQTD